MVKRDVPSSDATSSHGKIGTSLLLQTPFQEGEVISDRYRVERIVAQGGMGVIVAARHVELEEIVAIKFLKPEFASRPEIVGRFAREAKAAAKIKCAYTATVHDVGISTERGPYIVMEYLEGEDLESVIEGNTRLPTGQAVELMMQAGEALAVAHANGIIHRDIKPANLFLVRSELGVPVIKVLDFGISKTALTGNVFGGTISLVKTQSLVGSPIYMSPEQLREGGREVTSSTDIWSLGTVLYELLTGRTPFHGTTITQICASVLESQPIPVSKRVPSVPAELSDAVMRCLEKTAAKRWGSIAELVVALAPHAPKRAQMSVDRVVAVSRAGGLLSADFVVPAQLAPPSYAEHGSSLAPVESSIAPQRAPSAPRLMVETVSEDFSRDETTSIPPAPAHISAAATITRTPIPPPSSAAATTQPTPSAEPSAPEIESELAPGSDPAPSSRGPRERFGRARSVAVALLGAAVLLGMLQLARRGVEKGEPAAARASEAAPQATVVRAFTTPSAAAAAAGTTSGEATDPAAHAAPTPPSVPRHPPVPAPARVSSVAPSTAAMKSPDATAPSTPPPSPSSSGERVRSAIDDRK